MHDVYGRNNRFILLPRTPDGISESSLKSRTSPKKDSSLDLARSLRGRMRTLYAGRALSEETDLRRFSAPFNKFKKIFFLATIFTDFCHISRGGVVVPSIEDCLGVIALSQAGLSTCHVHIIRGYSSFNVLYALRPHIDQPSINLTVVWGEPRSSGVSHFFHAYNAPIPTIPQRDALLTEIQETLGILPEQISLNMIYQPRREEETTTLIATTQDTQPEIIRENRTVGLILT